MRMCWQENQLHFQVYMKPNQPLIYLNATTAHTHVILKAVTTSACGHLAKLTTVTDTNVEVSE
jgi:hypothetical protein